MTAPGAPLKTRWLPIHEAFLFTITSFSSHSDSAQGTTRTFPETGKTVKGKLLTYWTNNDGLTRPGFPISAFSSTLASSNVEVGIPLPIGLKASGVISRLLLSGAR